MIDAPIIAQAAPIAAVEGQPLPVTTILATFTDTDPLGTTTDYTATVNWGDGTPTRLRMIAEPAGPGLPFDVSQAAILGHTYAEEGNYVTTIVISDAGGSKTIVNGAVIVADAPLISTGLPTPPIIQEGTPFSGAVATFSDLDPAGTPSDYTATITWGDGVTTLGTIVPGTPGLFNVLGTHTFEAGTYTVSVVIARHRRRDHHGSQHVRSLPMPRCWSRRYPPLTETEAQSFTAPVGAFTDANALGTPSEFSATINWGDGSPATAGVISQQAERHLHRTGTHTYAANSTGLPPFPVTFSVKDIGGSTLDERGGQPDHRPRRRALELCRNDDQGRRGNLDGHGRDRDVHRRQPAGHGQRLHRDCCRRAAGATARRWPRPHSPSPRSAPRPSNSGLRGDRQPHLRRRGAVPDHSQCERRRRRERRHLLDGLDRRRPARVSRPSSRSGRPRRRSIPFPCWRLRSSAARSRTSPTPTRRRPPATSRPRSTGAMAPRRRSGTVVPGPAGTFQVNGSHTYADSGVNGGTGTFTIQAFDHRRGRLEADRPQHRLGRRQADHADGHSQSGERQRQEQQRRYHRHLTAQFLRYVGAVLDRELSYETPIAGGPAVKIGQVEAQSDGSWSVNSNVLADGTYRITATAVDQFGETTTVAPVTIVPNSGCGHRRAGDHRTELRPQAMARSRSTFKDNLSGMDLASLSNSAFYHISATPLSSKVHPPKLILPTSISVSSDGVPTDPVVVKVVFNHGHSMRGGNYEVVIDSGTGDRGIQDVAGNALDGNYLRERSRPATACPAAISSPRSRHSTTACSRACRSKTAMHRPAAGCRSSGGLLDRARREHAGGPTRCRRVRRHGKRRTRSTTRRCRPFRRTVAAVAEGSPNLNSGKTQAPAAVASCAIKSSRTRSLILTASTAHTDGSINRLDSGETFSPANLTWLRPRGLSNEEP